jgi:hypothetical protein
MQKWLVSYISAVLVIGAVVIVQNVWDLSKSDWAAWAQAVGATIGIGIAIWIPRNQRQYEADKLREAVLHEKARVVTNAHEIAKDALMALEGASTYMANYNPELEFSHTTDRLDIAQAMLKDVMNTEIMPVVLRRILRISRQVTLTIRDVRLRHGNEDATVGDVMKRNMTVRMERATESLNQIREHAEKAKADWREVRDLNKSVWR